MSQCDPTACHGLEALRQEVADLRVSMQQDMRTVIDALEGRTRVTSQLVGAGQTIVLRMLDPAVLTRICVLGGLGLAALGVISASDVGGWMLALLGSDAGGAELIDTGRWRP